MELKEENEKIKAELAAVKQRFAETQNIEIELKRQLQKQNNRIKKFEDESNLIVEENKLLKAQVSALLEGGIIIFNNLFVFQINKNNPFYIFYVNGWILVIRLVKTLR